MFGPTKLAPQTTVVSNMFPRDTCGVPNNRSIPSSNHNAAETHKTPIFFFVFKSWVRGFLLCRMYSKTILRSITLLWHQSRRVPFAA